MVDLERIRAIGNEAICNFSSLVLAAGVVRSIASNGRLFPELFDFMNDISLGMPFLDAFYSDIDIRQSHDVLIKASRTVSLLNGVPL